MISPLKPISLLPVCEPKRSFWFTTALLNKPAELLQMLLSKLLKLNLTCKQTEQGAASTQPSGLSLTKVKSWAQIWGTARVLQCFPSQSLIFVGLISFLGNDMQCLNQFHGTTLWQGADAYTRIKKRKEMVYLKYYLKTEKRPYPLSQKTTPLG